MKIITLVINKYGLIVSYDMQCVNACQSLLNEKFNHPLSRNKLLCINSRV